MLCKLIQKDLSNWQEAGLTLTGMYQWGVKRLCEACMPKLSMDQNHQNHLMILQHHLLEIRSLFLLFSADHWRPWAPPKQLPGCAWWELKQENHIHRTLERTDIISQRQNKRSICRLLNKSSIIKFPGKKRKCQMHTRWNNQIPMPMNCHIEPSDDKTRCLPRLKRKKYALSS